MSVPAQGAAGRQGAASRQDADERFAREAGHYDRVAAEQAGYDPGTLIVTPDDLHDRAMDWLPFLGVDRLTARLLERVAPLDGKRVLDLGSGTGFLSIALAHRGARVDALDISPASAALGRERASASGVGDRIAFHVGAAEDLPFDDGAFDAACGLFVLHHTDLRACGAELARVMAPGAPGAFLETLGFNPLLVAARAALPGRFGIEKASTEDERPLDRAALAAFEAGFGAPAARDCPELVFARMGAYIAPLRGRATMAAMGMADRLLGAVPGARGWSYFGLVTMRAPR